MEAVAALAEWPWNSFSGILLPTGEADFTAQFLANYSFPSGQDWVSSMGIQTTTSPCLDANVDMTGSGDGLYSCSDTFSSYSFPDGSNYNSDSGTFSFPDLIHENYHITDSNQMMMESNGSVSTDFCMVDQTNAYSSFQVFTDDNLMEEPVCFNDEVSSENMGGCGGNPAEDVAHPDKKLQHKRKYDMPTLNLGMEVENSANPSENPKKKKTTRVSEVQRNKKIVKSKKNQKLIPTTDIEGEANAGMNRQSSGSYCSEGDSDASQELKGGVTSNPKGSTALNLNGKTRASRGSATDAQSLYARKRRERINERLRILQNLVPNGTKVDISTMLEEAVQYVKFLQHQIKLLSSDDLWMYAPIAYNGVDIGLDLKISAHQ